MMLRMKTIMTMREMEEEREKMTELEGDKVSESHSVVSDCLRPQWFTESMEFSRPNTRVGSHSLSRSSQSRD